MIYLLKDEFDTKFEIELNEVTNKIELSIEDYETGITTVFYLTKREAYQLTGILHYIQKEML
jgi:hypothetical protein